MDEKIDKSLRIHKKYWAVPIVMRKQMGNGCRFSLVNDEQMGSKVSIEHQSKYFSSDPMI